MANTSLLSNPLSLAIFLNSDIFSIIILILSGFKLNNWKLSILQSFFPLDSHFSFQKIHCFIISKNLTVAPKSLLLSSVYSELS